jgi:hypothetical protein
MSDELKQAVAKFNAEHAAKSFSGRHPELDKMKNCLVCLHRHRGSIVCQQRFSTGTHDPAPEGEKLVLTCESSHPGAPTIKDVVGAARFAKKRWNPHFSHRRLQLVQLTKQIFHLDYELYFNDHAASMRKARCRANTILRKQRKQISKAKHRQEDISRRINRGLRVDI